ncbi:MAG: DUF47 family protein [Polyangiaceae bacterium]
MKKRAPRPVRRLLERLFPPTPDFLAMLAAHAALLVDAHKALEQRLTGGGDELGAVMENEAKLRREHIDALNRTFITPIDREDIYFTTQRITQVLQYIESTEREMAAFEVAPNPHIEAMLATLGEGVRALADGFAALQKEPHAAEKCAVAAIDSERRMESLYRHALAELFGHEAIDRLRTGEGSAAECMDFVVTALKAREIYRHLSDAADRVALAGETLHDIVVKWV